MLIYLVKIFKLLISLSLSALGNFIPKNRNKIIFRSSPDFSDSPRYIFEEIRKNPKFENHKFIWIVKNKNKFRNIIKDTTFIETYSFEWIKEILSSKYVISSHGASLWKAHNHINISICHGIPLKALFKFNKNIKIIDRLLIPISIKKINYLIVNSDFTKRLFSIIYSTLELDKIKALGYPRNDCLFKSNDESLKHLNKLFAGSEMESKKIIFYLPTFRAYNKEEDKKIKKSIILNRRLNDFLNENNIILIYKPHPVNENFFNSFSSESIYLIKNEDLARYNITIYDLLNGIDILITDYSSVYFDFLIVDKPIVFYCPDIETYEERRGFFLKPYYRWTPGDKARNISELIESIESAITNPDKYRNQRKKLINILYKHKDGRASERIINLLKNN